MSDIKEPTPEEIQKLEAYQEKMTKFYEKYLPFTELQAKYHQAMATISESRLKKLTCDMRFAEMTAPQEAGVADKK